MKYRDNKNEKFYSIVLITHRKHGEKYYLKTNILHKEGGTTNRRKSISYWYEELSFACINKSEVGLKLLTSHPGLKILKYVDPQ